MLECLHVDTTVKENQLNKQLPYTTKSGLQIGCNYTPPQHNYMSADAELLQMALLNIEPEFSQRRVFSCVVYTIFLIVVFTTLFALDLK